MQPVSSSLSSKKWTRTKDSSIQTNNLMRFWLNFLNHSHHWANSRTMKLLPISLWRCLPKLIKPRSLSSNQMSVPLRSSLRVKRTNIRRSGSILSWDMSSITLSRLFWSIWLTKTSKRKWGELCRVIQACSTIKLSKTS
jgi:hypothetical protein